MSPRLLVLSCVMFIVATNSSVIAGLLPHIAHDLHTTQGTVSYSVTVYALVVAVASPLASAYLSRVPRGALMAAGCALFAMGTAVAGTAPTVAIFMAGRAVAAIGGAALVPVAMAVGSSLVPPAHRGRAISIISVGFTVAGAFGAPLGTVIGSASTWRVPLVGLAGLGLVIGAVLAGVLRPSVLARLTYSDPEDGDSAGLPSSGANGGARHPLKDPRVVFTVAATLCLMIGFNSIVIFSAQLFGGATGGDGSRLALLLMSFGIASIVGNSLAGPMTDRFGNRALGSVFLAVFAVLLMAMTLTLESFAASAVAMALAGCMMSMVTVPIQHRLLALGEGRATQTLAWNSTAMYMGLAVAPPIANTALGAGGVHALPIAAGGAMLTALVLYVAGQAWNRGPGRNTGAGPAREPDDECPQVRCRRSDPTPD